MSNAGKVYTDYKGIVDINQSLDHYIDELIYCKLKFKSHLRGSHYLLFCIEEAIQKNLSIYQLSISNEIYPTIASHFNTDSKRVERAIRNAIEIAWKNMSDDTKKQVFSITGNYRPTNKEAICAIYDYIKRYYFATSSLYETANKPEKIQIINTNIDNIKLLNNYICELIYDKLGFKHCLSGTAYLLFYIQNVISNNYEIYGVSPTKNIYPTIASHFNTDSKKVERAIRNTIEIAWKNMSDDIKKQIFPIINNTRPTNTETIYAIYDYVQTYYCFTNLEFPNTVINSGGLLSSNGYKCRLRFHLQRMLEETFDIYSQFGIIKLQILVDSIIIAIKMDGVTDLEMQYILSKLSDRYGLEIGLFDLYSGSTEIDTVTPILYKMCEQIYQTNKVDFPELKDKTFIKTYLNILASQVKNKYLN